MRAMLLREAEVIVGGLSKPGKMPCSAISLPATACKTGAKLAKVPGSICNKCYALSGRYAMPNTIAAMERRMEQLNHPLWVDAMVALVKRQPFFRWFDSGDIQGMDHLQNIIRVAEQTPETKHWLPTKEYGLIKSYEGMVPENLIIRVSSPMIDQAPLPGFKLTATTHAHKEPFGQACNAHLNDGHCGDCRACWDSTVPNVSYKYHHQTLHEVPVSQLKLGLSDFQ